MCMKKKMIAVSLVLALALGLAGPTLAAGPSFTDVPESYWGYADIEAVAEAGLMNGTGGGAFSPEMKVSVAQFLTLLGRLVFPKIKAEGKDWYSPYVAEAKRVGFLAGTQIDTANVEAEITRYDMAALLWQATKWMGMETRSAQGSDVPDYNMVPSMYTYAVLAVYGMGLIKGDESGRFNGFETMTRAEVATVIMRLKRAPEEQAEIDRAWYESSRTGEYVTVNFYGRISSPVPAGTRVGLYFKDGRLLGETTTDGSLDATNYALWSMDITMDKADYSRTEAWYYAAVIGQAEDLIYGGMVETKDYDKVPESIWQKTFNTPHGFLAHTSPV